VVIQAGANHVVDLSWKASTTTGSLVLPGRGLALVNLRADLFDPEGWNTISVEARGPRVQVWLNGEEIGAVRVSGPAAGRIGLHLEGGPAFAGGELAVREVQVGDERALEPRLADTGGEREAERRELALEIGDARELASDCRQRGGDVGTLPRRRDLGDAIEDLERVPLRRSQREPAGNRVDLAIHCACRDSVVLRWTGALG
jgi:hypothetical protein